MAPASFYKLVNQRNIRLIKIGRRTYVPATEIMRVAQGEA